VRPQFDSMALVWEAVRAKDKFPWSEISEGLFPQLRGLSSTARFEGRTRTYLSAGVSRP